MRVRARIRFHDMLERCIRNEGEEFEVTEQRGQELLKKEFVTEIEETQKAKKAAT